LICLFGYLSFVVLIREGRYVLTCMVGTLFGNECQACLFIFDFMWYIVILLAQLRFIYLRIRAVGLMVT